MARGAALSFSTMVHGGSSGALPDYLAMDLDVVLVGINPGMRSAEKGHHFAGVGNKFWTLLFESGLVPERLTYEDDVRLPEFGIGITNIVSRASRSSADLGRADYDAGRRALAEKVSRFRPRSVAFIGVTVFREFWPELGGGRPPRVVPCEMRSERLGESTLFVLPNPSGRNAHFSYDEMLDCWRKLARWLLRTPASHA